MKENFKIQIKNLSNEIMIEHNYLALRAPQQNEVAKRKINRTL